MAGNTSAPNEEKAGKVDLHLPPPAADRLPNFRFHGNGIALHRHNIIVGTPPLTHSQLNRNKRCSVARSSSPP
jgi:hypothetical protein